MKTRLCIPFLPLLSIQLPSVSHDASACTGLAVYSGDRAWYGTNFDYPEHPETGFTVLEAWSVPDGEGFSFDLIEPVTESEMPAALLARQGG